MHRNGWENPLSAAGRKLLDLISASDEEVKKEMIKTVIFDIGNVLAGFAWEEYFRSFGYSEETFQRLAKQR